MRLCNIKGTYDSLKSEYKDLSIIHGAVAWETGVIRRLHDYGALGFRGDKIPSKTVLLVHKFFHRPPGSEGDAGFLVTKPVRKLPDIMVVDFVASMLVFLQRLPSTDVFKAYQATHTAYERAAAQKTEHGELSSEAKKLKKEVAEAQRAVLNTFDASDHPPYESPLAELAHYPIKAFLECAHQGYFSPSMPLIILQALLYKKTEGDRTMTRRYYEYLQKHLDCLAFPLPETWKLDAFSYGQRKTFLQEFASTAPAADVHQMYERYVLLKLLLVGYPPIDSYSDATIKDVEFTDCMDTALRNLINFLAYSPHTERFEVALLEQRLGTTVHPSIKAFYATHNDPSTVADKKVRDDWAATVSSNIPYLVYCRALPAIAKDKKDCVKVVHATEAVNAFAAKRNYVVLPESSFAYDLRPSLKNVILACDYLLGLRLFEGASPDVWVHDGFIATYLPKLVVALKASIPATLDLKKFDKNDMTEASIFVPFTFSFDGATPYHFSCMLHIDYDDGELIFKTSEWKTSDVGFPYELLPTSPASLIFFVPSEVVLKATTAEQVCAWLFAQDVADSATRLKLQALSLPLHEVAREVLTSVEQKA